MCRCVCKKYAGKYTGSLPQRMCKICHRKRAEVKRVRTGTSQWQPKRGLSAPEGAIVCVYRGRRQRRNGQLQ